MEFIIAVLLVSLRIGPLVLFAPVFSGVSIPLNFRILLTLAFSWVFLFAFGKSYIGDLEVLSPVALALLCAIETLNGVLLVLGVRAALAVYQFGGRLMDLQLGLGVATLIDPTTRNSVPLIGTLYYMLGILVFWLTDWHHVLLRGLHQSFVTYPLGVPYFWNMSDFPMEMFGLMFTAGFMVAAPLMFCLFLIDVAVMVVAKTMPQVNVFFLSLPLKIMVGFILLALFTPLIGDTYARVFESMFTHWEAAFR